MIRGCHKGYLVAVLAIASFGRFAAAGSVLNPSFESPAITANTNTNGSSSQSATANAGIVADWASNIPNPNGLPYGVFNVPAYYPYIPNGHQAAFIGGGGPAVAQQNQLYQDIGTLLPNSTYTLTADVAQTVGANSDASKATLYLYDDTLGDYSVHNVSQTFAATGTTQNPVMSFVPLSISYTTTAAQAGDIFRVVLGGGGTSNIDSNTQVYFDNLTLTRASSVPTPSAAKGACALIGLGLLLRSRLVTRRKTN